MVKFRFSALEYLVSLMCIPLILYLCFAFVFVVFVVVVVVVVVCVFR